MTADAGIPVASVAGDGVLVPWKMARADAEDLARIGALLRGE